MAVDNIRDLREVPIAVHTAPKPDLSFDPIYFTKASVKLGTTIKYYGRINTGTVWIVDQIWTFRSEKYGRVRSWVTEIRKLDDIVQLRNEKTGEVRSLRFEYLSSSARYRIETEDRL
jgi:hypothetical protein